MKARYVSVAAVPGAVDRLEWVFEIGDLGWADLVPMSFELEVGLYRREHSRQSPRKDPNHMRLPGRIVGPAQQVRTIPRRGWTQLEVGVDLPVVSLDRIERFRDGSELYVRLEGHVRALAHGTNGDGKSIFELQLLDSSGTAFPLSGQTERLHREDWNAVLAALRREHRFIMEVALDEGSVPQDLNESLRPALQQAQQAFDEGRYAETARLVYVVAEMLKKHPEGVKAHYGEGMYGRLKKAPDPLKAVADRERHYDRNQPELNRVDRSLALYLLTSLKLLLPVWFPAVNSDMRVGEK